MTTIRLSDLLYDSNIVFKEDNGKYYSLKIGSEVRDGLDDSIVTIILQKNEKLTKKQVVELD